MEIFFIIITVCIITGKIFFILQIMEIYSLCLAFLYYVCDIIFICTSSCEKHLLILLKMQTNEFLIYSLDSLSVVLSSQFGKWNETEKNREAKHHCHNLRIVAAPTYSIM